MRIHRAKSNCGLKGFTEVGLGVQNSNWPVCTPMSVYVRVSCVPLCVPVCVCVLDIGRKQNMKMWSCCRLVLLLLMDCRSVGSHLRSPALFSEKRENSSAELLLAELDQRRVSSPGGNIKIPLHYTDIKYSTVCFNSAYPWRKFTFKRPVQKTLPAQSPITLNTLRFKNIHCYHVVCTVCVRPVGICLCCKIIWRLWELSCSQAWTRMLNLVAERLWADWPHFPWQYFETSVEKN